MIKVILSAGDIPVDATVTKLTGNVPHILRDKVTVYGVGGERQEITAQPGCRFLVNPEKADITVIPADRELVWEVDVWKLHGMIENGEIINTDDER